MEAKAKVAAINGSVLEFETVRRERLPGLRGRSVFVMQRIEAVIGAYKKILAGDGRFIVVGWFVAYYGLCKVIPDQLNGMLQSSPGRHRPAVDIKLAVLGVSPGECAPALLLVVAAAVDMIEGEVSKGAPAIRYKYGRPESRHSLSI